MECTLDKFVVLPIGIAGVAESETLVRDSKKADFLTGIQQIFHPPASNIP